MLNDAHIEFGEVAIAGLNHLVPDESRRKSLKASIVFYLRRDASERSYTCPAFDDRELYLFPIHTYRILFEISGSKVLVWSIALKTEE